MALSRGVQPKKPCPVSWDAFDFPEDEDDDVAVAPFPTFSKSSLVLKKPAPALPRETKKDPSKVVTKRAPASKASVTPVHEEPQSKPERQVTSYSRKRRVSPDKPDSGSDFFDAGDEPSRSARRPRVLKPAGQRPGRSQPVAPKLNPKDDAEAEGKQHVEEVDSEPEAERISPPTEEPPEELTLPEFAVPRLPVKRRAAPVSRPEPVARFSRDSHELHSKGEMDMLLDDMEYQQQGLRAGQKLPVQQASAVQIITLLRNPKMRHMLRGRNLLAGVLCRLRDACTTTKPADYVLSIAALLGICVFARSPREALCIPAELVDLLVGLIKAPPKASSSNSKLALELSRTAHTLRLRSNSDGKKPLQVAGTALSTLAQLLRHSEPCRSRLFAAGGFMAVTVRLNSRLEALSGEGAEDSLGCLEEMCACLKVLDALTGRRLGDQMADQKHALLRSLCGALMDCKKLLAVPDFDFEGDSLREVATECILGVLRVLVNVTNEDSDAGACFAAAGGLDAASSLLLFTDEAQYDILALSLGLLINCVEHSSENKRAMSSVMLPPSGHTGRGRPGSRPQEVHALQALCELFQSRASKKNGQPAKQAQDNAIAAYSALLIGCIAQEESLRVVVLEFLRAESFGGVAVVLKQFLRDQAMAGIGDELARMRECIEEILADLS